MYVMLLSLRLWVSSLLSRRLRGLAAFCFACGIVGCYCFGFERLVVVLCLEVWFFEIWVYLGWFVEVPLLWGFVEIFNFKLACFGLIDVFS